jgi:phosphoenolpyruvate---glycerone phosphotransferase subunit DhaL
MAACKESAVAPDVVGRLLDTAVAAIREHAAELTALDQAIGDGDHGVSMRRGFDALVEARDQLAALSLDQALQKAGMTLVMKVGGASGPLYGSLLMAMGKAGTPQDPAGLAEVFGQGVEAVRKRGRAEVGEKTMLDVLVPALQALETGAAGGAATGELIANVRATAQEALAATAPMRATKGRASFLGERSIGHLDPGARSSALLIEAVCEVLEGGA